MDKVKAEFKRSAAEAALSFVQSGMIVGLGHGSTAVWAVRGLARRLAQGELTGILGVPCSRAVEVEARQLGIPLTTLEEHPVVDVTIDGADEVDAQLNLIKGGGGALLREKIVAQASRREIIVADSSKLSPQLGTRWLVPVEVTPFGWRTQVAYLESLGAVVSRRQGSSDDPTLTDQANFILDANFGPMHDPARLAGLLERRAGIVEHGLFLGLASDVIVAGPTGVEHLVRTPY